MYLSDGDNSVPWDVVIVRSLSVMASIALKVLSRSRDQIHGNDLALTDAGANHPQDFLGGYCSSDIFIKRE